MASIEEIRQKTRSLRVWQQCLLIEAIKRETNIEFPHFLPSLPHWSFYLQSPFSTLGWICFKLHIGKPWLWLSNCKWL